MKFPDGETAAWLRAGVVGLMPGVGLRLHTVVPNVRLSRCGGGAREACGLTAHNSPASLVKKIVAPVLVKSPLASGRAVAPQTPSLTPPPRIASHSTAPVRAFSL